MNIAEEAAKILHGLAFPLHHHHHESNWHTIRELQEILAKLAHINGELMNTSLARLQEAVAAQADLITAAQTRVNTLEAATEGDVDLTKFTANADLDALSTTLEANNVQLAAVSTIPAAPMPPAPSPVPSSGDGSDTPTTTTNP